jgi:hypothetical protein
MRTLLVVALASIALSGCAGNSTAGPDGEPSQDTRTVDVYAAVITYMAGTEGFNGRIYVQEGPCDAERKPIEDHEGDFMWELKDRCGPPFSEAEQQAIKDRVRDLGPIEFVADAKAIQDRIFEATVVATRPDMLIRFGRIPEEGDRLEIPASAYCGGRCGHWMTLVVQDVDGAWKVTGTTGPVAIS